MSANPNLICDSALWHYGVEIAPARAAELAAEVAVLNAAVRKEAAARLEFDSHPWSFAAILAEWAR